MLLDEIAQNIDNFKENIRLHLPYKPLFVKIKLVWDCNLKCQMCNHWRSNSTTLDIKILENLVTELAFLGCKRIHLTGGEPMMYPELPRLLSHIKKQGIRPTMTSNGTLISNEKKAERLALSGLRKINISIDSPQADIHDEIRGIKGSFKRTTRGFRLLRAYMREGSMRINMVVSPLNFKTVKDFPDLANDLGADYVRLIPLNAHTPELQRLTNQQINIYNNEIAPFAYEKALKYGLVRTEKEIFVYGTAQNEVNKSIDGFYSQDYYANHHCFALETHTLIDHLGNVSVCCMLPNAPKVGNILEESFTKIWYGQKYAQLRQSDKHIHHKCLECTMFQKKNEQIEKMIY